MSLNNVNVDSAKAVHAPSIQLSSHATHHGSACSSSCAPVCYLTAYLPEPDHASLQRRYAVRRVVFSPHSENVVASCSYDLTVRLWDVAAPEDAALRVCYMSGDAHL